MLCGARKDSSSLSPALKRSSEPELMLSVRFGDRIGHQAVHRLKLLFGVGEGHEYLVLGERLDVACIIVFQ